MRIISGKFKGRQIKTGSGPGYRPATGKVRESLFSILESMGIDWADTYVLDCFAGSGSLAMEALSRGCPLAWLIEKSPRAARLIRENLSNLKVRSTEAKVILKDLLVFLKKTPDQAFDLVFIDPPYGKDLLVPAVEKLLSQNWLAEDALVCAEVEAHLELEDLFKDKLELIRDKLYGQTRIYIWQKMNINVGPSTPEPLIL